MAICWELPIKWWRFPQACKGSLTALKVQLSIADFPFDGKARGEYGEAFMAFGEPCASTPLQQGVALTRV
jgi:hypothetical protein